MIKRHVAVYGGVLAVFILVVAGLLHLGATLLPPQGELALGDGTRLTPLAQVVANAGHPLARLLMQLIVIVATARALGAISASSCHSCWAS